MKLMATTMSVIFALLFSIAAFADTKISALPLGSGATTGPNDSFPYVDATSLSTKRLKLSDIKNIPSFVTFNAATATALAANPAACSVGEFVNDIAANGTLTCAVPSGGGGSSGLTVSSISSSTTLTVGSPVNYQHVACDATGGAVVATLPLCSGNVGQVFNLKKVDSSSNSCGYARTGADLIDGQTTMTTDVRYNALAVVCRAAGFWDVL